MRNAEALHWKERFAKSKDSKSFWKSVAYRNMHLKRNDKELVNDYDKAERLNHFFINVGKNLAEKSLQSPPAYL